MSTSKEITLHEILIDSARSNSLNNGSIVPITVFQELCFESWIDFKASRGPEPVLIYSFVVPKIDRIQWRYKILYHDLTLMTWAYHPISAVPMGIKKVLATIHFISDFIYPGSSYAGVGVGAAFAAGG